MDAFVVTLAAVGLPAALLAAGISWAAYAAVRPRRGTHAARRAVLWVLLGVAVLTLLWWTLLLANPSDNNGHHVNLEPLVEIIRGWKVIGSGYGVLNIWGNIAVFVPLGALGTMLWRGRWHTGAAVATGGGALLSASIETAQYLVGRSADVDDIILNTVGTALGAVLAGVAMALWRRVRRSGEGEPDA